MYGTFRSRAVCRIFRTLPGVRVSSPAQREVARGDGGTKNTATGETNGASGSKADSGDKSEPNGRADSGGKSDANSRPNPQEKAGAQGSAPAAGNGTHAASAPGDAPSTSLAGAAPNATPRPAGRPEVTRVEHPSNGSFDVVITQSAARDDLPGVGLLTGNPVYTVYLRVGDQKEWLMEYCLPVSKTQQSSPYQINIDDAAPLKSAYPISTAIPTDITGQAITKHIVIQGFLTAGGKFLNMKMPGTSSPVGMEILALLNEWQFRPASRDKKAIDVEILLVIPARS